MTVYDVRREFRGGYTTRRRTTRYVVVHHAAALYAQAAGIDDVRAVARYHINSRGWPGIGYHVALAEATPGGPIATYLLSPPELERAHVWGRNHECYGVSCLTNFNDTTLYPDGRPTQKWFDALVAALQGAAKLYPQAAIVGHRDIALAGYTTTCPGNAWPAWRDDLIGAVVGLPRYRVIHALGVNVRPLPRVGQERPVGRFDYGAVLTGAWVDGVPPYPNSTNQWLLLSSRAGYVWGGNLERVL